MRQFDWSMCIYLISNIFVSSNANDFEILKDLYPIEILFSFYRCEIM